MRRAGSARPGEVARAPGGATRQRSRVGVTRNGPDSCGSATRNAFGMWGSVLPGLWLPAARPDALEDRFAVRRVVATRLGTVAVLAGALPAAGLARVRRELLDGTLVSALRAASLRAFGHRGGKPTRGVTAGRIA